MEVTLTTIKDFFGGVVLLFDFATVLSSKMQVKGILALEKENQGCKSENF